jgi:DDE superfamily endonuclease
MTKRQAATPAPGPLEAYAQHFDPLLSTVSQRDGFRQYLEGLLLPTERNKTITALVNAEPIVGAQDPAVQALQWFLSESTWDADAVTERRVDLLRSNPATAPDGAGALVIDETGDRKSGTKTAHVGRQYLGSIGKVDNGVVSVTSLWADARVYYPLTVEPFTPKHHFPLGMKDPAYRTKPQIALELVRRAVVAGVPFRAVVADSFYGENDGFRTGLSQLGVGYVVALKPSHAWWAPVGTVNSLNEAARTTRWEGPDAAGDWQPVERTFRDAHTETRWVVEVAVGPYGPTKRQRVVIATTDPATLPELSTWYLVTNLPAPAAAHLPASALVPADLAEVVRLYGLRNWVEQSYKHVKGALGWNAYQVRKDHAIRRHWALVCCAFAFCWWTDAHDAPPEASPVAVPSPSATTAAAAQVGGTSSRSAPLATVMPPPGVMAGGVAAGAGVAGALGHARTLLARLVGAAAPTAPPSPARLAWTGASHRPL